MSEKPEHKAPKPGDAYEVPVAGSLGLLALGYRGWVAWQEKIKAFKQEQQEKDGAKNS